jgi:sodium/potassium/calcium exchanger 6
LLCSNPPLASALLAAWLVLLFSVMYIASDAFFCPTLELISDHLKLSPAVAGATLLAFGNGAPDVMTIVASLLAVRV